MPKNSLTANRGEWSELYAFLKLLKEGRIYAADENVNRIDNVYLPIIKIFREEIKNNRYEYATGEKIKIYKNGIFINDISLSELQCKYELLFSKIFDGAKNSKTKGSFSIDEIEPLMHKMHLTKVSAPSSKKIDLEMQIHDINTGYNPHVGFSLKSDLGSPPTLLNSGKNTRIQYRIRGLTAQDISLINGIDKNLTREYLTLRISRLFQIAKDIEFYKIKDDTFNDNLVMIDSLMPQIYGEMVLEHYRNIKLGIYDCVDLLERLIKSNPLKYRRKDIYKYKFKKLITASALGMTPGKVWNGLESATGGYIIVKKDGDVLCFHIYNRNYFEEYLLKNTRFDRPSSSRYDYGYIYSENQELFIDLNVQIRFKHLKN